MTLKYKLLLKSIFITYLTNLIIKINNIVFKKLLRTKEG